MPFERYRSDRKYAMVGPFKVYGFSADDANDQRRVRGMTLGGAWIDEGRRHQRGVPRYGHRRCSLPQQRIVLSTNPKGPYHWLKLRFIDRASEDVKRIAWQLADNPYGISKEYIAFLKRTLSGAALRRDVYGEWAGQSGLIYPMFAPEPPPDLPPSQYHVAIDFASSSVTHAVLVAVYSGHRAHVVAEWRHHGQQDGELTPDEQARRIRDWLKAYSFPARTYIDPAASHMRVALKRIGLRPIAAANDVIPGIYAVQALFHKSASVSAPPPSTP